MDPCLSVGLSTNLCSNLLNEDIALEAPVLQDNINTTLTNTTYPMEVLLYLNAMGQLLTYMNLRLIASLTA